MNLQQAEEWFAQHRVRNETAEETYLRLSRDVGSMAFHSSNRQAIAAIRQHRSATFDPLAFIRQFQSTSDAPERQKRMDHIRELQRANAEQGKPRDPRRSRSQERSEAVRDAEEVQSPVSSQPIQQEETADERKKRLNRERQQRYRARKVEEVLARGQLSVALDDDRQQHLQSSADRKALGRANETPQQREARLAAVVSSMSQHRADETAQEREARRLIDAVFHSQRRANETTQEREARRQTVADSMSQLRAEQTDDVRNATQELFHRANFDENAVTQHYCGPMDVKCQFCGSYNFKDELPTDKKFNKCCQKGKLVIPKPVINGVAQDYPSFLREMMSNPQNPYYRNFRDHVRSYNSSVSFASFGANLVNVPGRGPYVFEVQGQTYHLSSHTEPRNENERSYAQLYVIDSLTQAVQTRMQHPAMTECIPVILRRIHEFYQKNNSLARTYQLMQEVQQQQATLAAVQNVSIPLVHMAMRTDRQADERRFNLPTANEVAMIFVNEDGEPPFHRDIRVYPRNPINPGSALFRLNIRNCNLDSMVYSLMFPYGQPGWHPEFLCNGKHFSMLQFKSSLMAIRDEFSPIMHAGRLTQQWLVDSYLQVEAHNLEFLRSELYQGLADFVNTRALQAGVTAGRPVILPSTFQGSPRNMRQKLQDAMAIFGKFGAPDLFVTFTANPNWREVQENTWPGETASDRADLIGKVEQLARNGHSQA